MNKESIYDKYIKNADPEWTSWELKGNFLEELDQYAEQEAISFNEWVTDQRYSRLTNGNWKKTRDTQEPEKTTSELYNLYLSQKK